MNLASSLARVLGGREALLVRALCVQAWAKAALGSHLRAVDGINHVLKAVAYILQVSR